MRKATYLLMIIATLVTMYGCQKKSTDQKSPAVDNTDKKPTEADSTVYGKCVAGAMSSMEILNAAGDTVQVMLEGDQARADVQGGIFEGDKMAIVGTHADGSLYARKVINLTSLMGKWTSLDKNFDMKEDGVVVSHISAESKPYTSWKIFNGKLLLSRDTFEVLNLGPDSLVLENQKGIYVYKRQK